MNPRTALRAAAGLLLLGAAALPSAAFAQARVSAEERTARYFESVRDQPPLLTAFLREMPKGGDLHSHLSGAVYAESYLRWAVEDSACINVHALTYVYPPCTPSGDTLVRAAAAVANTALYGALIDAWSMRNWNPARPQTGHDQFFDTFGKFGAPDRRTGDGLAEAASRAALGRVSYLELMLTADGRTARDLGASIGWLGDFARMRDTLLKAGIATAVVRGRARLDSVEARRDTVLRCGTPRADPGCAVTVRWLYQVFAQILTGFLLASADPRVVGFNLVQPEDAPLAMGDYSLHMRMIEYLRGLYPGVEVSLHAGELAPGLVPPEGLRFHVREAVLRAGARRIGHGVDVMHEEGATELLREMARRGVMVEIALTSNDVILGVRGKDHPLSAYLAYGVPVALATDDEGVSRSEMTMEYLKAAREQGLGYRTLKAMARNSLQHAFIEGESLWRDTRSFTPVAACAAAAGGIDGARCREHAARSPKARLQHELERAFADFERRVAQLPPP
jgi:adenosine deaminase